MESAFLLLDKPVGPTSHDMIDKVRRATGEKRVGHAGTLDPFASGLLIVGVGRGATREMERFVGLPKTYEAVFTLGASSDTDDRTGKITAANPLPSPLGRGTRGSIPLLPKEGPGVVSRSDIESAMKKFLGEIEQIPPAFSAIKIGGQKMYEAARKGKPLEAKPRRVTINRFELLEQPSDSKIRVAIDCSSGTYIRALARDLGAALGTGGYVEELRRTAIGPFSVEEALKPSELADWRKRAKTLEELLARLSDQTSADTLSA